MTITHNIPSTVRRPGQFHEFDLTSSAQGLVPLPNRVLLVGVKRSVGTAPADAFQQVFDELQADLLFGAGSEAALMCRKALETGRKIGFQPEIYCSGIADPAGTAATYTITVATGSAAAAGDIVFRLGEVSFRAGVSAGDNQTAIATAIVNAINEKLEQVPVTAASALGVVTLTFRFTGVNGNGFKVLVDDVGLIGLTVTPAAAVAGVGAAVPDTALLNSLSLYFEGVALANHAAADITTLDAHLDAAWAPSAKRWKFSHVGENGTLGTANALSAAANDQRQTVTSYEDSPSMPLQIAAAVAVAVSARELPNYNWDFEELPLAAPPDASVYTDAELESALAAGTTPLKPNDQGATEIVRLVTTKTLEGGNPFERAKDLATMRGLVYVTRQIDVALSQQFKAVNKSARVRGRIFSVIFNLLKAMEELEIVQNVDALAGQLLVEDDPVVPTRAVVSVPESIIPNLHQIVTKHVLFVE